MLPFLQCCSSKSASLYTGIFTTNDMLLSVQIQRVLLGVLSHLLNHFRGSRCKIYMLRIHKSQFWLKSKIDPPENILSLAFMSYFDLFLNLMYRVSPKKVHSSILGSIQKQYDVIELFFHTLLTKCLFTCVQNFKCVSCVFIRVMNTRKQPRQT